MTGKSHGFVEAFLGLKYSMANDGLNSVALACPETVVLFQRGLDDMPDARMV